MSHFSALQAQLCVLLESSKWLLSQGAFCPKLLWQEYRRDQVCVCVCAAYKASNISFAPFVIPLLYLRIHFLQILSSRHIKDKFLQNGMDVILNVMFLQRLPKLEVVYHLHFYNILTLKYILERYDYYYCCIITTRRK